MGNFFPYHLHWPMPHSRKWSFFTRPFHGGAQPGDVRDAWRARDGTAITLRAARPEDAMLMQELVRGLSSKSRYQRFFYPARELTPDMVNRFTHNTPSEAMTLLAVIQQDGRETVVAMAQYVVITYPERCDFAVLVADAWQREGLGSKLIQALVCIARAAGIERIEGDMLAENEAMLRLALRLGFTVTEHADGAYLLKVAQELAQVEWKCSPLTALAANSPQSCAVC